MLAVSQYWAQMVIVTRTAIYCVLVCQTWSSALYIPQSSFLCQRLAQCSPDPWSFPSRHTVKLRFPDSLAVRCRHVLSFRLAEK